MQNMFFTRPSATSQINDSESVLRAIKNDLGASHVFGVYPLEMQGDGTSFTSEHNKLVVEVEGSLNTIQTKDHLDIIFVN